MHTCPNCHTPLTQEGRTDEGNVMSCPNGLCPLNRITDTYANLQRMDIGKARSIQAGFQVRQAATPKWRDTDEERAKDAARAKRYGNKSFGDPE